MTLAGTMSQNVTLCAKTRHQTIKRYKKGKDMYSFPYAGTSGKEEDMHIPPGVDALMSLAHAGTSGKEEDMHSFRGVFATNNGERNQKYGVTT
jgi:hypothetical protein